MGLTAELAAFVAGFQGGLPEEVVVAARRSLVNVLAACVGAGAHPAVEIACRTCADWGSEPRAGVLGRELRLSLADAAWVNGIAAHVLDFDDTHPATIIHVSAPVLPAVLALADDRRLPGAVLLDAFALGAEVALRLGMALFPSHYDVGFHITGTAGAVGAAAAVARLLRLDAARTGHAMGIAAAKAAGLRVMFGSMTKSLQVGNAARTGVEAALLAAGGFTAAADALEGRYGLLAVTSRGGDPDQALPGLGEHWLLPENTFKAFPCGIVAHPVCDGALELYRRRIDWRQVRRVDLTVHPRAIDLTGNPLPADGLEGKFSIYHCAAAALVFGALGEAQYTDAAVTDPRVVELRGRVAAAADASLGLDQARIVLTLADGRRLEHAVEHCLGSAARPMLEADITAKFRVQTPAGWPTDRVSTLLEVLWGIEAEPDVRRLVDLFHA